MMNKFWFLVGNSFKKKTKSKWFFIVNIILLVAIVSIMNIDSIIKFFGGDFDKSNAIFVIDETNTNAGDYFKSNLNVVNESLQAGFKFDIAISNESVEEVKKDIEGTEKILVVFSKTIEEDNGAYFEDNTGGLAKINPDIKATIISDSYMDTTLYQVIYQAITQTSSEVVINSLDIDPIILNKLGNATNIDIERVFLNEDNTSAEEQMSMIMGTVFPTVILPFFMLVVFLVQMIGAEINEEKQTRSMEVIISNVSPKVHFFSKMVASNAFVLMQGALLIIYSLIALLVKNILAVEASSGITKQIGDLWNTLTTTGFADKLVYIIPLTLILMILSFITYSLLAGVLASMTVNMEDFQHIQTPIMMVLLAGYYLAIMAGMFEGSIFIRALSYLPGISCILSPALLVIGQIGIIDVIISIIIICIFNALLIKYGLRIYKIGVLNYSTDKMWKRIFKAAKTKN